MSSSVTSLTDSLPMGLLSSNAISGATDQDKLKSCCKALEGLFTSEMLKEIGQTATDAKDPASNQYGDFIQQALSQQVTSGGGLGLAQLLEKSLTPATKDAAPGAHVPAAYTPHPLNHAIGTH